MFSYNTSFSIDYCLGEQQKEFTKILADALVKGLATVGAAPTAATSSSATMECMDVVEEKLQRMDEKIESFFPEKPCSSESAVQRFEHFDVNHRLALFVG